jgi:hypothetical protein
MKKFICMYMFILLLACAEGCAPSSSKNWLFKEEPSASVVTQKKITDGVLPILYVFRDSVDGQWIFLADEKSGGDDVVILTLSEIITLDPSMKQLSDLPPGWKAWREAKGQPWSRTRMSHENK